MAPAQAQSGTTSELYDYLVQDVCTDANDQAINGDPADCETKRDIRVSEASPYLMTDWDTVQKVSYSAWNSIPVRGEDGNVRVMVSKSLLGTYDSNFVFSYSEKSDGFDLIDLTFGPYSSIIRTSDGGCLDQLFAPRLAREMTRGTRFNRRRPRFRNDFTSPEARSGGWILFPLDTAPSEWPQSNSRTHRNTRTPLQSSSGCNAGGSTGITYWNSPKPYTFEGNEELEGKTLVAIRSDHFGKRKLSSKRNALERFYFTREYGMTRWEAWIPRTRCLSEARKVPDGQLRSTCYPEIEARDAASGPELDLRARCKDLNETSTGHPDVERWGGQDWVRVDCRDQTRYVELNKPVLMLDKRMAQINGVDDIDY